METFSLMPKPGDEERIRVKVGETRVWWVRLRPPVARLFCTTGQLATMARVEFDMGHHHGGTQRPTDRDGVWCVDYAAPLETLGVEHEVMGQLMALLRANGCHGRYREAGTQRWYEF